MFFDANLGKCYKKQKFLLHFNLWFYFENKRKSIR